jgi:hypothetical protein
MSEADNMSEEEMKIVEIVENFIKYYKKNEQTGNRANLDVLREECNAIEFILNKYDIQQKELEQEKEKNTELEEFNEHIKIFREKNLSSEIDYVIALKSNFMGYLKTDYVSKDKIREELIELDNMKVDGEVFTTAVNFAKKILKELLEEE